MSSFEWQYLVIFRNRETRILKVSLLNTHFKDDPISDMRAKCYLIILCMKPLPGPSKFGPVFSGAVP